MKATTAVLALVVSATALPACGARCADIAARKQALIQRTAIAAGPHAQVRVPLARANALLAAIVHDQPIRVPLALPDLGPLALPAHELTAVARDVELRPAPADRLRFAIRIEIDDAQQPVTTLAVIAEVAPALVRAADASELVAGFGPDSLLAVTRELGPDSGHALVDAVARWLPPAIRDHLPRAIVERAAAKLADYLTGEAYQLLRVGLLRRLGELTRLRLRLPALPIASTALTTTTAAMTVDLTTDLPVRHGLDAPPPPSDDVEVRISGSTAAELANWSIDHGHLPQHYTRDLEPRADGRYRPRFDYLASEPQRPVKLHVFQDRGGCSYFQVGLRMQIELAGDQLIVALLDRRVEVADASAPLELALWLKQLLQGSIDSSRRAAAHTRLTVGGRTLVTRVVRAAVSGDELDFALQLTAEPTAKATDATFR